MNLKHAFIVLAVFLSLGKASAQIQSVSMKEKIDNSVGIIEGKVINQISRPLQK